MTVRALQAPVPLAQAMLRRPRVLATALDLRHYGWFAATGTLLHAARPLLRQPRDYDAIVAHFGPEGVVAEALRHMELLRGPLVTFFHGYDLTQAPRTAGRGMYRTLFERAERLLAISEHGAAILRRLGAPPEGTLVHHMGVDVARFAPRAGDSSDPRLLRVLSIGRLVPKKGFADGIDAFARVLRKGVIARYDIIGDGPERHALERKIAAAGLQSAVCLRGAAGEDAVRDALRQADVLLVPSVTAPDGDHEGIPVVIMEALASGIPVVATSHGGIPEIVRDGTSGILAPEHDVDALAAGLERLAADHALRERMGSAGREIVATDFDAGIQNERLELLLAGLARTPHNH